MVAAVSACGSVRSADTDAGAADPDARVAFAMVTRLDLLSRVDSKEADPSLTDDELELFFSSNQRDPSSNQHDLWVSRRRSTDAPWGEPTLVDDPSPSGVNSDAMELWPKISPDGMTLWFGSNRPRTDDRLSAMDIYTATRSTRTSGWSEPARIDSLSSPAADAPGTTTSDGDLLAIDSGGTAPPARNIYLAQRSGDAWSRTAVSAVNSPSNDSNPNLSADGLRLLFASDREFDEAYDLYLASRPARADDFVLVGPLSELNTSWNDEDPWMSADGARLYFASDRPVDDSDAEDDYDLYVATF
jgi:Tol biopolymer transport system component